MHEHADRDRTEPPEPHGAGDETGVPMQPEPVERQLYRFWAKEPGHVDQQWCGWWRKHSATWCALFGDGVWSSDYVTRWEPVEVGGAAPSATGGSSRDDADGTVPSDAHAILAGVADRMDEHTYSEVSTLIENILDQLQVANDETKQLREAPFACDTHMCGSCKGCRAAKVRDWVTEKSAEIATLKRALADERTKIAAGLAAVDHMPLIASGILRDIALTPDGRGGELHHIPATPGHGKSGCPGDNLSRWPAEIRAALTGPEPEVRVCAPCACGQLCTCSDGCVCPRPEATEVGAL